MFLIFLFRRSIYEWQWVGHWVYKWPCRNCNRSVLILRIDSNKRLLSNLGCASCTYYLKRKIVNESCKSMWVLLYIDNPHIILILLYDHLLCMYLYLLFLSLWWLKVTSCRQAEIHQRYCDQLASKLGWNSGFFI